jgi:hypothetical protein
MVETKKKRTTQKKDLTVKVEMLIDLVRTMSPVSFLDLFYDIY